MRYDFSIMARRPRGLRAALLVLAIGAAPSWKAAAECGAYSSAVLGRSVAYCIDRTRPDLPANAREPVVYFLHPLGGNGRSWFDVGYSKSAHALALQGDVPAMSFVTFDTEPNGFFSDWGGEPSGPKAYETWFIKEFIPFMEGRYGLCAERGCRGLLGFSMGGQGALKMAFKYPGLFSVVAANSAALTPLGLYEPMERWREYFGRQPVGAARGLGLVQTVRFICPTKELADRNDPIELARSWSGGAPLPSLYFDVGDNDDWGFQEGFEIFRTLLQRGGVPHTAAVVPGATHAMSEGRIEKVLRYLGGHFK